MKTLKNILAKILLPILLLTTATNNLQGQELNKATVENLVNSKNFVFNVRSVTSPNPLPNQNMSGYEVRLLGDSIVTNLPYFGRVFTSMIGRPGGFNFTSTKFEYKSKARKKGRWDVSIKPQDEADVREMIFSISESGYATLQVFSNNRQPISYGGYISVK